MSALRGGSASTCSQCTQRAGSKIGDRRSDGAGSRDGGGEDRCEGDHLGGCRIEVVGRMEGSVRERMTVVRTCWEGESSCSYTFRQCGS